ncbi:MAG TPA: hypothetical protein VNO32_06470 [Candidatus Acidoferrum sp.]|nr:hypothetical protein [Candidatus Acidoferrum sp.]
MQFDSESTKQQLYSPPTLTKLTPEQVKQVVASHANSSDHKPTEPLESLRQEQQRNEK